MFLDKNEAKRFLLINHARKAIHHHHNHYHDLNENEVAAIRGFKEIILTKKTEHYMDCLSLR